MINLYIFYIIMIIFGLTLTIIAIRLREIEGVFLVFIILSIFIIGLSISELNNITNISMLDKYSDICGISRNELVSIFKADIRELANENEMTYDEALSELQHHYDGYHFSGRGEDVYNPYSLFNTLASNEFDDYWFSTGTPTFLIDLLQEKHLDLSSHKKH